MGFTDTDYTGWKNGKCYWLAVKFDGNGSASRNAETVAEMVRKGYEVREMLRAEAVAAHIEAIPPRPRAV